MLHRSVGPAGAGPRRSAMCFRRRTRMRNCKPSRRYSRRTHFLFTGRPSRRNSTQMHVKPNRGRAWANSRMRDRKAA